MADAVPNRQEIFAPKLWFFNTYSRALTPTDYERSLGPLPKGIELYMQIDWRTPLTDVNKLNPVWAILKNDWDPVTPDWSWPGAPQWLRDLNWWFRNPAENMKRWTLGACDRNCLVRIVRRDGYKLLTSSHVPQGYWELYGWEWGELILDSGERLPWIAYGSDHAVAYWGWQPVGTCAMKFNRLALLAAPIAPVLFAAMIGARLLAAQWAKKSVPVFPESAP